MTRSFVLVIVAILFYVTGEAQATSFSEDLKFAQYLQNKQLLRESEKVLRDLENASLSVAQRDSLYYQLGWLLYTEKKLNESSAYLLNVSSYNSNFYKARFFAGYDFAYLGASDTAKTIFNSFSPQDSILRELQQFELAGLALLNKQYEEYNKLSKSFTYSSYAFATQEKNLGSYDSIMRGRKLKSPVLAGIYSAVMPGLGKYYAGKKKQAIGSFLPIASLGLLTYEAYRKGGVKSARFITFGSLFSIFYVANIWGSTVAVKVSNNEFYDKYDKKILLDLHLPLRSLFN